MSSPARSFRYYNEVVVARDGEGALDYLYRRGNFKTVPNGNPAFLLFDLKLPKVDELEACRSASRK
jgi:hypothetical protein